MKDTKRYTKTQLKEMAKEVLFTQIRNAGYVSEEYTSQMSEKENEQFYEYLYKYGQKMAKIIGEEFYFG